MKQGRTHYWVSCSENKSVGDESWMKEVARRCRKQAEGGTEPEDQRKWSRDGGLDQWRDDEERAVGIGTQ